MSYLISWRWFFTPTNVNEHSETTNQRLDSRFRGNDSDGRTFFGDWRRDSHVSCLRFLDEAGDLGEHCLSPREARASCAPPLRQETEVVVSSPGARGADSRKAEQVPSPQAMDATLERIRAREKKRESLRACAGRSQAKLRPRNGSPSERGQWSGRLAQLRVARTEAPEAPAPLRPLAPRFSAPLGTCTAERANRGAGCHHLPRAERALFAVTRSEFHATAPPFFW